MRTVMVTAGATRPARRGSPAAAALRQQAADCRAEADALRARRLALAQLAQRDLERRMAECAVLAADAAALLAEAEQMERDARDVARLERGAA